MAVGRRRSRRWMLCSWFLLFIFGLALAEREPIQVPTDGGRWYGNDGFWSTASIRLGNPAQYVYVLIGTSSSETWAVSSAYCDGSNVTYECDDRGEGFSMSDSTSWNGVGQYALELREELKGSAEEEPMVYNVKDYGYGEYGLETIKMKKPTGDKEWSLDQQIVATVNDTTYLLGMMGLGVREKSFENETTYPSMLSTLYDNGTITSRSFGYTAGAYYRSKKVPMDLVMGGTNLGRYQNHDTSFKLDAQQYTTLAIQKLTVSATGIPPWGSGPETLLNSPILAQVDSSTPFLWLPSEVCRSFEDTFGLVWDSKAGLYLMNETDVDSLKSLNLTFTFTVSDSENSEKTVDILVPYDAFDLEIGFPYVNQTSNQKYFPIKRATDEKQYTLGRSFLQEAYLVVDYDRGNFSLHQAHYPPIADNVSAIYNPRDKHAIDWEPTSGSKGGGDGGGSSLSPGAIAGIAVGAALAVALASALGLFLFNRRRQRSHEKDGVAISQYNDNKPAPAYQVPELGGDQTPVQRHEMPAVNYNPAELAGPAEQTMVRSPS